MGDWYCTVFTPLCAMFAGFGIYAAYATMKVSWRKKHNHDG